VFDTETGRFNVSRERLREVAPGIEVDVLPSNYVRDLRRREADIAIRHGRPDQPHLIATLLGETEGGLYAATRYLDRYGRPATPEDVSDSEFIGFDRPGQLITYLNEMGVTLTKDNFKLLTESGAVAWEWVQQGLGIGVMADIIADRTEGVEGILPELPPAMIPIWLVTPWELRTSRRIRIVLDVLAETLKLPR
jgi:DNA-binding transcriptional LysR family regulator